MNTTFPSFTSSIKVEGGERQVGVVPGPDSAQDQNRTFERLVSQYQTSLLRTCYMTLRNQQQAEDAVQETFLKAYRNLGALRGESLEKAWLMKIAVNTCRDMRRTSWFLHIDQKVTPEMLPDACAAFEQSEESLIVDVMNLPLRLREVILLYYYQNMDTTEIAQTLGIARSSVSGRLQRARKKLRDMFEGMDCDEG